ncbi:hypothetical protein N7451_001064 [Penicillium sp. IBT 35674x]|nr:hypothetical protein N7451_001064 [Penicillium sp. IBT 35674x]
MRTSFLLAAALTILGTQAAESSTIVGIFEPNWDVRVPENGQKASRGASLAGINANAATYHIGCPKNAAKTDCNIPTSWTIVQGAETASLTAKYIASTSGDSTGYDVTVTEMWDCKLKSSTESASCTMSIGMSGSAGGTKTESSTTSKVTYSTVPIDQYYFELTVTSGLSSFTMPAATETGAAAGPAGAIITAAPVVAAALAALL